MGYQESLLFCKDKRSFEKLCRELNAAKPELEELVDVYAIGKLKTRVNVIDPLFHQYYGSYRKGTYFVWWGGERHPYQSGSFRVDQEPVFYPDTECWKCEFCEGLDPDSLLAGIDTSKEGIVQENDKVFIIEIHPGEIIRKEYIQAIEAGTTSPRAAEEAGKHMLNETAKDRTITFDDILMFMDQCCEERVRKAVANSKYTEDDMIKTLKNALCIGSDILRSSHTAEDDIELRFRVCFTPEEAEGISVFWSRWVTIRVENKSLVGVYCSEGSVAFEMYGDSFEIDMLCALYEVHPEAFDPMWYCA